MWGTLLIKWTEERGRRRR